MASDQADVISVINELREKQDLEYRLALRDAMRSAPVTFERAARVIDRYHDSYSRLSSLFDFLNLVEPSDWLRLLGERWSVCDNITCWSDEIYMALEELGAIYPGPVEEMMAAEEMAAWQSLPEEVTVYRGCSEVNRHGLCWSLDREIAAKFPFMLRYTPPQGERAILVTASVPKLDIIAVKLDRQETEIITFDAHETRREYLPDGAAKE